jgi:hypothetical protein
VGYENSVSSIKTGEQDHFLVLLISLDDPFQTLALLYELLRIPFATSTTHLFIPDKMFSKTFLLHALATISQALPTADSQGGLTAPAIAGSGPIVRPDWATIESKHHSI